MGGQFGWFSGRRKTKLNGSFMPSWNVNCDGTYVGDVGNTAVKAAERTTALDA
jgi:hypothetical protein